jgi:hypothetical protein
MSRRLALSGLLRIGECIADNRHKFGVVMTSKIQIAVVVGSLRRESFNQQLANAIAKLASAHFDLKQVRLDDLPPTTRTTTPISPRRPSA